MSQVTDILCGFLQLAVNATLSAQGEICLKEIGPGASGQTQGVEFSDGWCKSAPRLPIRECGLCVIFLEGNRKDPLTASGASGEARCARRPLPSRSALSVAVRYQGATLGVMTLTAEHADHYTPSSIEKCQLIASEIAYHLKRHEMNETAKAMFGRDLMLVGTSDSLRRVDEFIERAAQAKLPALILGEFGCEKRHVAYALHFSGRRDYPLVEVRCATLDPCTLRRRLRDQLRRADGGTIFFNGVDDLDYQAQCELAEVIEAETSEWLHQPRESGPVRVRLVASARGSLDEQTPAAGFCEPLLEKFDFLLTRVAPLRDRREDIKPLVEYFANKHKDRSTLTFSSEVVEAFESYDWPRNVYELERIVARLSVLSEDDVVKMQDVLDHAPKLAQRLRELGVSSFDVQPRSEAKETRTGRVSRLGRHVIQLAQRLIDRDFAGIRDFHPGLRNALEYIGRNLHETITLPELSRHAALSASHLAYLFQKNLGLNFKAFVAAVRIEEAKQLLTKEPHMRITEVSFQVGFGDLRHFERTFKRLVGQPPKEYRDTAARPLDSENSS